MPKLPRGVIRCPAYYTWLPQTNEIHNKFVRDLIESTHKRRDQGHLPAVTEFSKSLTHDQKMLFETALHQVRQYYSKWADPDSVVTSFDDFLTLLDGIIQALPPFYKANIRGVTVSEPISAPLCLTLDLVSNTSAACNLFNQPTFNAALKVLLNSWGDWLKTSASSHMLADQWFSEEGLAMLESSLRQLTFDETYKLELGPPQRYSSWDSFFTREFKDTSVRPIAIDPDTPFLYNACEGTVSRTATNVWLNDTFWLKAQNYSLHDILGGDDSKSLAPEYAPQLTGGSAYQAFLSPGDYHRWHSPMIGNILASQVFDGTYYAALLDDGAPPYDPLLDDGAPPYDPLLDDGAPPYDPLLEPGDPHGAIIRSQTWLTVAATRTVYIIQPTDDDSPIELAAFVAVGMIEVSSCDITKATGAVEVGDKIGTFHFGGSSYALFVKPKEGYELVFQDFYNTPIRPGQHRWINFVIGQFRSIDTKAQ